MIKVKSSGQRIFFPVLTSQVEQLVLVAFCDASHKSMPDRLRSVEGVTVFLVSKVDNKAAVLQWVSRIVQRSKGVQTSPSAAEAIALNLGLALLKELKVVMEDILQQEIETVLVTDSKNVYQQVNSSVKITDPQASLDIANIRDPLETGAINHVTWVKSGSRRWMSLKIFGVYFSGSYTRTLSRTWAVRVGKLQETLSAWAPSWPPPK